jgi:hypothetical protein
MGGWFVRKGADEVGVDISKVLSLGGGAFWNHAQAMVQTPF